MNTKFRRLRIGAIMLTTLCSVEAMASERIERLALDIQGIKAFRIDAENGFLHIEGTDSGNRIEVTAEHVGNERNHRLSLEKRGDSAVLISHIDDWPIGWVKDSMINLTVKIPSGLALEIDDGSGEITLSKVNAKTRIEDGSGSIEINNHRGDLKIHDGSGAINIETVVGDVDIDDGSGSIEVGKVDGHVTVDDGSGSINIDTVSKGLTIEDAGSGGVNLRNVAGRITRRD